MKAIKTGLLIILALSVLGCNNYFHDLMPPNGNRILSFSVEGQLNKAIISDDSIITTVGMDCEVNALIPNIKISPKATLFPLTLDYLERTFPGIDVFEAAVELHKAEDLEAYVEDLIRKHPDFKVPVLDSPIDFSGPVNFIVLSGQGNIRQYSVNVIIDSGFPHLINFGFYKYYNPELINDALSFVNENNKTIYTSILYPVEVILSYELIPVFEILGDRIVIDGVEVRSGTDTVKFAPGTGTQTKTITVWRDDKSLDYNLTGIINEDPDSVRSIIDFRFNKIDNAGISINAVASIINNDALGTINAQVFYSGAKPEILIPKFISPGNVTVNGIQQISGSNTNNFSSPVEYRVVSRNNKFVRTYTVNVDFIDINSASPVISGFKFSSVLNHELVQDTLGVISEGSGQIMVTAKYSGLTAPETLIPEFSATGLVKVSGAVQTSGFSAQNFSRQVKYTVTNPENSLLTRDYWVQVNFIRDTSSDASITSFSFHPDENTGLNEVLTGKIDNNAGKITIYAPIGSGVSARTMYPRFTSAGQVSVNNVQQTSGASGQIFNTPLVYKVVSANGINSREYLVTVRELRSTIYVDLNAHGEGDGSSWKDAFRHLEDACHAAAEFNDDVPKEIWIAKGTYKPSSTRNRSEYFPLTANTSYIGGFAGNETSKSERNAAANPVVISGDLGGGVYSYNLFGSFNGNYARNISGDVIFEDMAFEKARASSAAGDRQNGSAISVSLASTAYDFNVKNCTFNDFTSVIGGAIWSVNGKVNITDSAFIKTSASSNGGAICLAGSGNAQLSNIKINDSTAGGLGGGIYTQKQINISGLTIDTAIANTGGGIYSNHRLDISNSTIRKADANQNGGGIYISTYAGLFINEIVFEDCISYNVGGAIYKGDSVTTPTVINNSKFINCTARNYGNFIFNNTQSVSFIMEVINCEFTHTSALRSVGQFDSYERSMFGRTGYFEACTFNNLVSNTTDDFYFFSNRYVSSSGSIYTNSTSIFHLTLKGCTFNPKNTGKLGLVQMLINSGDTDYLLVDNNVINNYNGEQNLFWLQKNFVEVPGLFNFTRNNYYNGILLDTEQKFIDLGKNIFDLRSSARVTLVP